MPYVDINGAVTNTSAATGALNTIIIFIYVIFKLMHETLSDSLKLFLSRIMS
jgi:hypothetical protein